MAVGVLGGEVMSVQRPVVVDDRDGTGIVTVQHQHVEGGLVVEVVTSTQHAKRNAAQVC